MWVGLRIEGPLLSKPGMTSARADLAGVCCNVGGRISRWLLGVDVANGIFLSPGVTLGDGNVLCARRGAEYEPTWDDLESSESYCRVIL